MEDLFQSHMDIRVNIVHRILLVVVAAVVVGFYFLIIL